MKERWKALFEEIFITNAPRYKDPSEWQHLWIDFWVSLTEVFYPSASKKRTKAIAVFLGIAVPVGIILLLI